MGWDGIRTSERVEDVIRKQFDDLVDLHIAYPNAQESAAYGAFRSRSGLIVGVVIVFERRGDWLYLKTMDESMGPYYYDCPVRILDQLSPLESFGCNMSSAAEWRQECRARAQGVKARVRVRSSKQGVSE